MDLESVLQMLALKGTPPPLPPMSATPEGPRRIPILPPGPSIAPHNPAPPGGGPYNLKPGEVIGEAQSPWMVADALSDGTVTGKGDRLPPKDVEEGLQRSYDTLRWFGEHPLAAENLRGRQMDRADTGFNDIREQDTGFPYDLIQGFFPPVGPPYYPAEMTPREHF